MKLAIFIFSFLSTLLYSQINESLTNQLDSLLSQDSKCLETNEYDYCMDKTAVLKREIFNKMQKQNTDDLNRLQLSSSSIDYLTEKRENFILNYSKLLELDSFNNLSIQNAIIKPYSEKYDNGKDLSFKFESKTDVNSFIVKISDILQRRIIEEQFKVLGEHYKTKVTKTEMYINKNLKKLNISRKTYDEMSDNDKEILWKSFQQ